MTTLPLRFKNFFFLLHKLQLLTQRRMQFSTGLILLLPVLGIIFRYLQKHQEEDDGQQNNSSMSSSPDQQQSLHEEEEEEDGQRKDLFSSTLQDNQCRHFSLAEIKLATNDFDDVIGKGGFGNVYKGTIDSGEDVAIKRLKLDSSQGAAEFQAEIEMLSQFRHIHIVPLLGYHEGSDEREMILIYKYMSNGSLEDHLHKRRVEGTNSSPLTWVQRLQICIGAARGLDYLHSGTAVESRVIHRDIKSSNILLDENLAAKISDFGLSRIGPVNLVGTTNVYTDQIKGTFGYMAPEYLKDGRLTRNTDVYAFGVVLLEVLCGRPAVDPTLVGKKQNLAVWAKHYIKGGKADRIVDPCLRGQTRARFLKEFGQIAYECLIDPSKDRPSMTKVVFRLDLLLKWTLQSDQKHIGRSTFLEKSWSFIRNKAPKGHTNILAKKLGQSDGVAATSEQVVLPTRQTEIPILKEFTFSELRIATRNFSPDMYRGVGEGWYWMVYKGWLDGVTSITGGAADGLAVAIKRVRPESAQGVRQWQAEIDILGTFTHPNVVKLFGYCREKNKEYLLVYEYMQKQSLNMHLFKEGGEPVLPWETRINIAMGAAQGLAFLHIPEINIIYGDVKTSNILLDEATIYIELYMFQAFNAKLSYFGLAKVGPDNGDTHVSTSVAGSLCYLAPEYAYTGRLYAKSDVYAFGVVMLEIITGLSIENESRFSREEPLVDWVKPFFTNNKELQKIMDPRLQRVYPLKGAMKAAKLIQNCLDNDPKHRPSMEEVMASLEEINSIKI
ncbi:hypothetical protein LXL04_022235 [Taraxacum kok-saghyz]